MGPRRCMDTYTMSVISVVRQQVIMLLLRIVVSMARWQDS
jgi:hypothetical protein